MRSHKIGLEGEKMQSVSIASHGLFVLTRKNLMTFSKTLLHIHRFDRSSPEVLEELFHCICRKRTELDSKNENAAVERLADSLTQNRRKTSKTDNSAVLR